MLGAMVTDVDERGLEVKFKDGRVERINSVAKIWAAGVQANPLGKTLSEQTGAPLDRAGRIAVNPDLTLPGHPEVFVVGDMIALDNLPGVAQVAIQGAKYAAKEISNRLEGKQPQEPFKYFDKGSMAIISRFRAVAMVGKFRLTGIVAWLMWLGVHLVYLTGFKNQVSALMRWAITFISNNRSERTTTEQQIFARAALARLRRGAADLVSDPGIYDATRAMMEETRARSSRPGPRRRPSSPTPGPAAYPRPRSDRRASTPRRWHTAHMLVTRSLLLFALAALAEIGGAWLVWQGVREHKGWVWIGAGVVALGLYGFVATLQPDAHFGRILAAYGGVFVAGSLAWGMVVDGFRPDRYDVIGALVCLVGVAVIMYAPRVGT